MPSHSESAHTELIPINRHDPVFVKIDGICHTSPQYSAMIAGMSEFLEAIDAAEPFTLSSEG